MNAAIMFIKNIPGLRFKTKDWSVLYESSPDTLDEEKIRRGVALCQYMRYGDQEDSMQVIRTMTDDVVDGSSFQIGNGLKFYIEMDGRCYPLLSCIDEMIKTRTMNKTDSIRITGIESRTYASVQEIVQLELAKMFDEGISVEFSPPEFSPEDFIEREGEKILLRDILRPAEGFPDRMVAPTCTKVFFEPESEYMILHMDTLTRLPPVKTETRIDKFFDRLVFTSGAYELISFVTHLGSTRAGHYINYSLIDGVWYEFNDSTVTEKGSSNFHYSGTPSYMLYRRI